MFFLEFCVEIGHSFAEFQTQLFQQDSYLSPSLRGRTQTRV